MKKFSSIIQHIQKYPSPHQKIDVFVITYCSEGLNVKGFMAIPKGERNLPGIVYLRGGIKNIGMVRISRVIEFASQGFVVIAPFYRGNKGGEGREDFAGDDVADAINAFTILKECPNVDPTAIHLFGFSRGGVMALLTAMEVERPASVVTWGGVSDMVLTYEERVDLRRMMKRVIGGTPNKLPKEYERRTAIHQASRISCPILIVHGVHDKQVSVEHAYRLQKALQRENINYESWIYEEYGHHIPLEEKREITKSVTKWMKSQHRHVT